MKFFRNEKGVALVLSLVLAFISMAISTATIYMVLKGTEMSGLEKRYTTALGAAKGALEITAVIINTLEDPTGMATINNSNCFLDKLMNDTSSWTACNANESNTDVADSPDIMLTLGSYTVYVKIIDSSPGNTKLGRNLEVKGVVESLRSFFENPTVIPRSYRIEVLSVNTSNSLDRARLTALYAN